MTVSHAPNITVTVTLDTSPIGRASFSVPLAILLQSTSSLGGDRTRVYTGKDGAQTDNTLGELSAAGLAIITRMFAQNPPPAKVIVGRIDDGSGETEAAALLAIKEDNSDFYVVTYEERTAANVAALGAAIESDSKKMLGVFQSSDSDWKTSGVPSAYSAMSAYERSAMLYHDDDTDWNAEGWAAARAAFNADETSATWTGNIGSGDAYSTAPTAAERLFIIGNNCNLTGKKGSATRSVDPGYNLNGRPIYEMVSVDWLSTRVQEDILDFQANADARGEKITVDERGGEKIRGLIQTRLDQGAAVGHFDPDPDQRSVVLEDITAADLAAERLRFTVRVKLAVSARIVTITVFATRNSITN